MPNRQTGDPAGRRLIGLVLTIAAFSTAICLAGTYAIAIGGEADEISIEDGSETIQQARTKSETPARIATRVAERIEQLKVKFPHLAKFSATEHLHKNTTRAGFAPGTPNNPELYSIDFHNGVLARKAAKGTGPKKSAEYTYDPQTGISLYVHFFNGKARGNDLRPAYKIGDVSVHAYVDGPAWRPIREEVVRILDKVANEIKVERNNGERRTSPPEIGGAQRVPRAVCSPSKTAELVLSMGSMRYMLDLDTGQTMDPPAMARPELASMDVRPLQEQLDERPTGLYGLSLQGLRAKASDWDASFSDVRRALMSDRKQPMTRMQYDPTEIATYFFRTRAGTVGILQLLALVEEPQGIRIRYKAFENVPRSLPAECK